MSLFEVRSARAEHAEYRVNRILAEYRSHALSDDTAPDAIRAAFDAVQRLVTVAEMYTGEHLVESAEARLPDDELVLRLWERRTDQVVRDWRGRREGWSDLFELKWNYDSRAKLELEAWILVRNIITHGLGRLTRAHLRRGAVKPDVIKKLGAISVSFRGQELTLVERNVERCARRIVHFVHWLDDSATSVLGPPKLR